MIKRLIKYFRNRKRKSLTEKIRSNMPLLIQSSRVSKYSDHKVMVDPFSSGHAREEVVKILINELMKG